MPLSSFEIIGPPMIGPSSSHTAGACRIGWAARQLLSAPALRATVHLHGSFAATGAGHGTREALAAGILGLAPDDERLPNAIDIARSGGMALEFRHTDFGVQAHPNSTRVELSGSGQTLSLTAESIGGGSILIVNIDNFPCTISGTLETLVLWHQDHPGLLSRVTALLACLPINVASIRTSRFERGGHALTTIEIDGRAPSAIFAMLDQISLIQRHVTLPVLPGF